MFVATYCTRMAGGFLRFQAQYLRRIRLPHWRQVPEALRARLIAAATATDTAAVDAPVFELYGLSAEECALARKVARDAQVTARKRKESGDDDVAVAA
jgi:hypothetical protein